jgi:ubiquinone/menaquinone biosynthesis C-methylase UbiE
LIQQRKIESLLLRALGPDDLFEDGLDYGCGCGRMLPLLSDYCEHIWAADILESSLDQARGMAPNVTPVALNYPLKLAIPPVNFLWCGLVFQHIVEDALFDQVLAEIARVLAPGARILILDNGVDKAFHVKPRGPDKIAAGLKLKHYEAALVTIDVRPNDHWLVDGTV